MSLKRYTVPVVYTTTGWVGIKAADMEAAKKQARYLNDVGIDYYDIQDGESSSLLEVDEIESSDDEENDEEQARYLNDVGIDYYVGKYADGSLLPIANGQPIVNVEETWGPFDSQEDAEAAIKDGSYLTFDRYINGNGGQ